MMLRVREREEMMEYLSLFWVGSDERKKRSLREEETSRVVVIRTGAPAPDEDTKKACKGFSDFRVSFTYCPTNF